MSRKKYFTKEDELASRRAKYHENRHKLLPIYREKYRLNKVEILKKMKYKYHNDIEFRKRHDANSKKYRSTSEYKNKRNAVEREKLKFYRNKVFEILGGYLCIKCNYKKDKRALQIDHIFGNGTQERKLGYDYSTWKRYADNPELTKAKFQVLCCNCNILKRYENNEF